MRVNVIIQPLFYAPFGKAFLHITRGDAFAQFRQKSASSSLYHRQVAQIKPVLNPRHGVATNRQAALFAFFLPFHHPHFARLGSGCLISSPPARKDADPRITSLPALPDRARRGIVDINIQQPIHIIDVDVFGDDAALSVRNTFRQVSFEFILADQPVKKSYVAQKP